MCLPQIAADKLQLVNRLMPLASTATCSKVNTIRNGMHILLNHKYDESTCVVHCKV